MSAPTHYPVFVANQVLRNDHLNDVFRYLDAGTRLTRSQLVGVGLVCGAEVTYRPTEPSIEIGGGLGVTSSGRLVLWDDPGRLTHYRAYAPPGTDRETFPGAAEPPPLYELLTGPHDASLGPPPPGREVEPLTSAFLTPDDGDEGGREAEKVVVLYLELAEEDNRNCDPNGCDDRGLTMHAAVVPLLVARADLGRLGGGGGVARLASDFALDPVRLPRVPAPGGRLVDTADVRKAYVDAAKALGEQLGARLDTVYDAVAAFLPDVGGRARYGANPLAGTEELLSSSTAGGLGGGWQDRLDHLVTVARAYEQLRGALDGRRVACRPAAEAFPRHLCLGGVLGAAGRHRFAHAPVFGGEDADDLARGFGLLVALVREYRATWAGDAPEVLVTPSRRGRVPLSERAVPYLYRSDDVRRRWGAAEPLGYWLGGRGRPYQPRLTALEGSLEAYDFLRVEGHLGRDYREALGALLETRREYRLPIDVVAVRTGSGAPLAAGGDNEWDEDLEALYVALREQFLCRAAEVTMGLYELPLGETDASGDGGGALGGGLVLNPNLALLAERAPTYVYRPQTVGALYERELRSATSFAEALARYETAVADALSPNPRVPGAAELIRALEELAEGLPERLADLDGRAWGKRYGALEGTVERLRADKVALPEPRWANLLDAAAAICLRGAVAQVVGERDRRRARAATRSTLGEFARRHPGLTHGAGVPLGGTLVLVYHGDDTPERKVLTADVAVRPADRRVAVEAAVDRRLFGNPATGLELVRDTPLTLRGAYLASEGMRTTEAKPPGTVLSTEAIRRALGLDEELVIAERADGTLVADIARRAGVGEGKLAPGTVIADFFLPYVIASDGPPIRFALPHIPPALTWEQVSCTRGGNDDSDRTAAEVQLSASGGTGPYAYTLDNGESWLAVPGDASPITVGDATTVGLRDATGARAADRTVRLSPPLAATVTAICDDDRRGYTLHVRISGGKSPYSISAEGGDVVTEPNAKGIAVARFTGERGVVTATDAYATPCSVTVAAERPEGCTPEEGCDLPCGGAVVRSLYPFWTPGPAEAESLGNARITVTAFRLSGERSDGLEGSVNLEEGELDAELAGAFDDVSSTINPAEFDGSLRAAVERLQKLLDDRAGEEFGGSGASGFTVEFLPAEEAGLGGLPALAITHYACHRFELRLRVEYGLDADRYAVEWDYAHDGFVARNLAPSTSDAWTVLTPTLPPLNGATRNRCEADSQWAERCDGKIDVDGLIVVPSDRDADGGFEVEGAIDERQLLWVIPGAWPAVRGGSEDEHSSVAAEYPEGGSYPPPRVILIEPMSAGDDEAPRACATGIPYEGPARIER